MAHLRRQAALRRARVVGVAVLALAPTLAAATGAPVGAVAGEQPGDVSSVTLKLLASHNLASPGLDGQVRPRGNNGDLSVLKDTAYVAGGSVFHGSWGSPGRICTDFGGVKVVDLSNPSQPVLRTTITIADNTGITGGPVGNPRRGQRVNNVSVSASAIDARSVATPTFTGDVLAIATHRCEQALTTDGRIEFYDVTNPGNPVRLGTYATAAAPNGWGLYDDVRIFPRSNGRLYAIATLPFSGNEVRVIDITDLRNPVDAGAFPAGLDRIDTNSVNACKPYVAGKSAAPTPDGNRAIVSLFDGTTSFGPNPAAVVNLDLDNLPKIVPGSNPPRFEPVPPRLESTNNPLVEGNYADVQPFNDKDGRLHSFVSEDDIDPAITNLTITGPGGTVFDGRGCEILVGKKLYEYPNQQIQAPIVYGGLACSAQTLANITTLAPELPPVDVRGALVVAEAGSGCAAQERLEYLMSLGALGVMQGNASLDTFVPGSEGGYPAAPNVVIPTAAAAALQLAPNAVVSGHTFPASYQRTTTGTGVVTTAAATAAATELAVQPLATALAIGTHLAFPGGITKIVSAPAAAGATSVSVLAVGGAVPSGATGMLTNVTVRPLALAVTAATTASPIVVTTQANVSHGLTTGDRVAIAEVGGNTAANGTFTVTVLSPTSFSLNGSVGNGTYTGGGYVVFCAPANPNCTAAPTRTDRSRHQSAANAADRVAGAEVVAASRADVVAGRSYTAGATVEVRDVASGSFRVAVTWYNAGGTLISESEIVDRSTVTPFTRFNANVTAPAGAVKAGLKYGWTGAAAEGTAYVHLLTLSPNGLTATLRDNQGEWGSQKIVDFSTANPSVAGTYRSPTSRAWPPPDNGIYAPHQARLFGRDIAFTTWMSDGLRVLDVSRPSTPREVASFVPPDVADPSALAGAGPTNQRGATGNLLRGQSWPNKALVRGVDVMAKGERNGIVVVSDINAGIYVLSFELNLLAAPEGRGYWSAARDGGVFAFGAAPFLGSMGGRPLAAPIVGLAPTPTGKGYWLVASDGGVFAFGDAQFHGSTGAIRLNRPMVGMAPTPSGKGYWLVASDGGVFAFGDARFTGSTGAIRLNQPILGLAATPSGAGYWLAASDGGVFAFGDARFHGSTGGIRLNRPVVGITRTPTGNGYWLAASDGGVFAFGDAPFLGSTGAIRLNSPMVGIAAALSGRGYRMVAADGGVFAFGDAPFLGSTGAIRLAAPIVALVGLPQ